MRMQFATAVNEVYTEYLSAKEKFSDFECPHKGYAVILEELDELWELIKTNDDPIAMRKEAKQIAAMAIRFMVDLCS